MNNLLEFQPFAKMARLSRECIVTEKIDGTNAQICLVPREEAGDYMTDQNTVAINDGFVMFVGSRTRWIRPKNVGEKGDPDNYGFAAWCRDNAEELFKLGPGRHFGEWYGRGINRAYGLEERRFALFNTSRWAPNVEVNTAEEWGENIIRPGVLDRVEDTTCKSGPSCCFVVPVIWRGNYDSFREMDFIEMLRSHGSFAAPGFMRPEGIVVYHVAANTFLKKTLENDESPKSKVAAPDVGVCCVPT